MDILEWLLLYKSSYVFTTNIYLCLCVHTHTDMQILKLCGVVSHLFGRFHLCMKFCL